MVKLKDRLTLQIQKCPRCEKMLKVIHDPQTNVIDLEPARGLIITDVEELTDELIEKEL